MVLYLMNRYERDTYLFPKMLNYSSKGLQPHSFFYFRVGWELLMINSLI